MESSRHAISSRLLRVSQYASFFQVNSNVIPNKEKDMPSSKITTNFNLENQSGFIEEFHKKMMRVLKIPEYDRFVVLDQKNEGFYQPTNTEGYYILFEIDMFSGRTIETKRTLYKELVALATSFGVESSNVRIILKEIEKDNWGIRGGQPASEIELGFKTNI